MTTACSELKARETFVRKYGYQLEQFPKIWGELINLKSRHKWMYLWKM